MFASARGSRQDARKSVASNTQSGRMVGVFDMLAAPEWFWSREGDVIERGKPHNVKHARTTSGVEGSRATGRG